MAASRPALSARVFPPETIFSISGYPLASAFQEVGQFFRSALGKMLSGSWLPILV